MLNTLIIGSRGTHSVKKRLSIYISGGGKKGGSDFVFYTGYCWIISDCKGVFMANQNFTETYGECSTGICTSYNNQYAWCKFWYYFGY